MSSTTSLSHVIERRSIHAALTVIDGQRRLKPSQVSFDQPLFADPPHLTSSQVEIILIDGDAEQRHIAAVLPHDADATRIPIQLVPST